MYISKITLENVKCFQKEEIILPAPGTSIIIAGNNGAGKSAIIRSIAMGLCDRDSAAALLRELSGDYVRLQRDKKDTNEARIYIELHDETAQPGKERFIVETKITEYPELTGETVTQKIWSPYLDSAINVPEDFNKFMGRKQIEDSQETPDKYVSRYIPWSNTFVAGYGPGLRTIGTTKFTEYFAPDALYSIFNYSSPLQDPEVAWRRLVDAARKSDENKSLIFGKTSSRGQKDADETDLRIGKLIHGVLGLKENEKVLLEPNGIFIQINEGGTSELIELDARGDGHKALAKIVLDILIWYLLYKNSDESDQGDSRNWTPLELVEVKEGLYSIPEIQGIVIIDELEQHLHPILQRKVIQNLHTALPNVQFIISTHSALCLSGVCDLPEGDKTGYQVYSVYKASAPTKIIPQPLPKGKRADQILVDYFELETTLNISLEKLVNRYRALVKKQLESGNVNILSQDEKNELAQIELQLKKTAPLVAEREDDRRIELEMLRTTEDLKKGLKKPE